MALTTFLQGTQKHCKCLQTYLSLKSTPEITVASRLAKAIVNGRTFLNPIKTFLWANHESELFKCYKMHCLDIFKNSLIINLEFCLGLRSCFKDKPQVLTALLPGVMFSVFLASRSHTLWKYPYQTGPRTGRTLQQSREIDWGDVFNFGDAQVIAGYVLGCISATFYVCAQIPQIIKNVRLIVKLYNYYNYILLIFFSLGDVLLTVCLQYCSYWP